MKRLKGLFFAAIFVASGHGLFSQTTFQLTGKVLADDFSPLSSATVYVAQFSFGIFTDSTGGFRLQLKEGWNEVAFSFTGYKTENLKIFMRGDTTIEVKMKTDLQLNEVVIVDKQKLKSADHDETGTITLRKENFLALPALLGENDPMRAVQMQPGIQSGNEGATGIFVRGGSPDQNLMLIDGTPVFNPSHIYGFISVFNGDAVDKVDVYKDSYPARFGGRLASVMEVETDGGNDNQLQGSVSIGVVSSRFHLDGPLGKDHKTTFSLSVRGCYIGLFTSPISEHLSQALSYNDNVGYYFDDLNAKLVHQFGAKDKIEWSLFLNDDFYSFKRLSHTDYTGEADTRSYLQNVKWSNYVSSLTWDHQFNPKWSLSSALSFTDYSFTSALLNHFEEVYNGNTADYRDYNDSRSTSFIREITFKSDAKFLASRLQTFRSGAAISGWMFGTGEGAITTEQGFNSFINTSSPLQGENVNALESSGYLEDEIRPSDKWLLNCGFHVRTYTVSDKTFASFLPRFNILFSPVKNFSLRSSVSGLSQNLHLLTTSNSDILNDYWVPATKTAVPETGWNFSGGMIQKLPLNFEWSVDGFYRTMKNLIDYQDGADYTFQYQRWDQQIVTGGIGKAYGLETYVTRNFGILTGSIAYTLAGSDRKFADLNMGNWFPYKYDRRHDIAMQMNYLVNKHIELGASWVYGSGNRTTLPLQYYNSWGAVAYYNSNVQSGNTQQQTGQELTAYTARNAFRLPSYQHLDLSFIYKKRVKKLEHVFNCSIYNVYNHFNVFLVYADVQVNANGTSTQIFRQLSLFPILPSVAYTLKFGV